MVDILRKNSKYVILAGDDDQAIYGWAGADVLKFIATQSKKDIILPQSHRVPRSVQIIADKILDRIPDDRRVKKNWKAIIRIGLKNNFKIQRKSRKQKYQTLWMMSGRHLIGLIKRI